MQFLTSLFSFHFWFQNTLFWFYDSLTDTTTGFPLLSMSFHNNMIQERHLFCFSCIMICFNEIRKVASLLLRQKANIHFDLLHIAPSCDVNEIDGAFALGLWREYLTLSSQFQAVIFSPPSYFHLLRHYHKTDEPKVVLKMLRNNQIEMKLFDYFSGYYLKTYLSF